MYIFFVTMNRICLVVLIGLPGAGKTTFCQQLLQMRLPFNILHLCYDDLIKFNSESSIPYKEQRENILKFLRETVVRFKNFTNLSKELQTMNVHYKSNQHNDHIILCDDNHYYRSMRYKLFQIAREKSIGYCQIYFNCKAQLALERNSLRNPLQKVPNNVILQMCSCLEIPNTLDNQWEKNTMILEASKSLEINYQDIISFIIQILNKPVQSLYIPVSKSATSQSKVHELDLLLRKHIKSLMSSCQNRNSTLAKNLNEKRKETLVLFQKDIACGLQNIDINKYIERFNKF